MHIQIYSKHDCNNCVKAEQYLQLRGFKYEVFKLDEHYTRDELLSKAPNARSLPQIFIDGQLIGGFESLKGKL